MRIAHSYFISIILFFLCHCQVSAQGEGIDYYFHDIKESNSQRAISTIIQDHKGFIWIGTNGVGLNKFNGIDFTYYKQRWDDQNTINSSLIHASYIDTSNRLWVGTEAGLNLYDRKQDQFIRIQLSSNSEENPSIPITAISENKDGHIVVGTLGFGIYMLDPESLEGTYIPIQNKTEPNELLVNTLIKDGNGKIFAGTNEGLFEYNALVNQFNKSKFKTSNSSFEVSNHIQSLFLDDQKALWIGTTANGLLKIASLENISTLENFPITNKRVLSLIQDSNGILLCGTENDGLFTLEKNGRVLKNYRYNKFDKNSIESNSIWSLFLDEQERIWIGYYNKGIGVYDPFYDKFNNIESLPNITNSLQSGSVTGIAKDHKERLWIGMDGGGVDIYDPIAQSFTHLLEPNNSFAKGLNIGDVQTVFIDSRDNAWVGSWNSGIYFLEKNSDSFKNYNTENTKGSIVSNRILSFSEDSKGTVWIGTFLSGLHSYNPISDKFTHHNSTPFLNEGLHYTDIRKVLVDRKDQIWLGTTRGLFKVIKKNNTEFTVVSLSEQMNTPLNDKDDGYFILSLFEDNQENLWIGTDGGGLCKYDPKNDSFFWYNTIEGVEQETVSSVIADENGAIWFAGNQGLSKLDTLTNTFTNYTKNDGLLANDFNNNAVLKENDGTLYFGNYMGLSFFKPENVLVNEHPPSLYFSDLKLFNASVEPNVKGSPLKKILSESDSLVLNSKQSVFTIEYTGIGYTRPEENQYAYYLEGFENTWNYVGNTRSATYTNLPKGNYTFLVKAANNDGVWNQNPIALNIEILPPWWATNIAFLSYFIITALLTYVAQRIINERIKEKRLVKFERDKRLQEEALNDRKIQFFTNISHEFRTPLTLIQNPLEDIIHSENFNFPENIKEKHKIIHKNTTRLSRLIDELLDFRKLQFDKMSVKASEIEPVGFVTELTSYFEEEAAQRNILLSVEADTSAISIWADPGMLEKIIFNILSNAFKATPENGAVTVRVSICANDILFPLTNKTEPIPAIEIVIEDTGLGMKQEQIASIFERFYQAKEMNQQYYGGTGIGLEVVSSFIKLHKGKILVESKERAGTKFSILLPLGNSHFDTSELFLNQSDSPKIDVSATVIAPNVDISDVVVKKKTLLIIEDNSELRSYIKGELQNDYIVAEAINGKEGIDSARKMMPDVIVTDVLMPEMDGYEFCTLLRKDLKTSHIPVLMLTAKAMSDDWVKGIDSGADVYLSKPFEMKILRSQLRQLIKSRQLVFNKYFGKIINTDVPDTTSSLDKDFIVKVLNYINENMDDANLNVEHLAEELFLSRSQLYRKIKALTGQTANEFLKNIRLEKAKEMISTTNDSMGEISFKVGFSSPSYFTSCFKTHFGILPTEVKRS
ncbi:response regulator [Maribacter sp.]|nr:response regulator [Maribacter sp.]